MVRLSIKKSSHKGPGEVGSGVRVAPGQDGVFFNQNVVVSSVNYIYFFNRHVGNF